MSSVRERLKAQGISVIGRLNNDDSPFYRDFDHPIRLHVRIFGEGLPDSKMSITLSEYRMLYPESIQWENFMARCLDLGINRRNLLLLVKEEIINKANQICPIGTWELPIVPTFNVLINRDSVNLSMEEESMEEDDEATPGPVEEESTEEDDEATPGPVPAAEWSIQDLEMMVFSDVGSGEQCAICLDKFVGGIELTKMPCCHLYHEDCIVGWLRKSNGCPLCRFEMPTRG